MPPLSSLNALTPPQRFMYDYGCFMVFWSNFDVVLEVAICKAISRSPRENCSALAWLTTGQKRAVLEGALAAHETDRRASLAAVFAAVDRNGWVHGTVLNPKGDFSQLTRLRVRKDRSSGDVTVTNGPVDFSTSPFDDFYPSDERFMQTFAISVRDCNEYIQAIQGSSRGAA